MLFRSRQTISGYRGQDLLLVRYDPSTQTSSEFATVPHGSAVASDGRYLYVLQRPHHRPGGQQEGVLLRFDPLGFDDPVEGSPLYASKKLPADPGLVKVGDQLLIVGGTGETAIQSFDLRTGTLRTVGELPSAISNPTVVHAKVDGKDKLYVVGGVEADPNNGAARGVAQVLVYEDWELKTRLNMGNGTHPIARANPSVVQISDDRLLVSGGWIPGSCGPSSSHMSSHEIDLGEDKIRSGSRYALPDRKYGYYGPTSTMAVLDGRLLYLRGYDEAGEWALPQSEKTKEEVQLTLNLLSGLFQTGDGNQLNLDLSHHRTQEYFTTLLSMVQQHDLTHVEVKNNTRVNQNNLFGKLQTLLGGGT